MYYQFMYYIYKYYHLNLAYTKYRKMIYHCKTTYYIHENHFWNSYLHEYNFSVTCSPSGSTIPPNLLCYRSFEVYLYVFSFAALHFRQVSVDSGLVNCKIQVSGKTTKTTPMVEIYNLTVLSLSQ